MKVKTILLRSEILSIIYNHTHDMRYIYGTVYQDCLCMFNGMPNGDDAAMFFVTCGLSPGLHQQLLRLIGQGTHNENIH